MPRFSAYQVDSIPRKDNSFIIWRFSVPNIQQPSIIMCSSFFAATRKSDILSQLKSFKKLPKSGTLEARFKHFRTIGSRNYGKNLPEKIRVNAFHEEVIERKNLKSPASINDFPQKGSSTFIMSRKVRSKASRRNRWAMGASSHTINLESRISEASED